MSEGRAWHPRRVAVIGFVLCCRSDREKIDRGGGACVRLCACVHARARGRGRAKGEDAGFREGENLERSASEVSDIDSPKFASDEGPIPAIPEPLAAHAHIDCWACGRARPRRQLRPGNK